MSDEAIRRVVDRICKNAPIHHEPKYNYRTYGIGWVYDPSIGEIRDLTPEESARWEVPLRRAMEETIAVNRNYLFSIAEPMQRIEWADPQDATTWSKGA